MIADLGPYPEYKESGLPWLGQVPEHWPVLPNRAVFAEVKNRKHPGEEMLSVTITRGIVRQKTLLEGGSKKDGSRQDKSAYKLVEPGDIAYNKMRAWQGAIGASDLRGIISPAYVVMRLRHGDCLPRYFHDLYRTPQFAKEAERWSYGITSDMWSLRPEHFKTIYSPLPPPAEQTAIVRFLDWANGRLERATRAKRKVIALLNEQKQAIIHRAVTRGLDPSVPLKPSGVPWLGDIPQHWEVRRLRTLVRRIDQGVSPLSVGFLAEGDSWGVLKSGCVNRGTFRETEHKRLARTFEIDPSIVVKVGDVLVSRACGSPTLVGSVGRVKSLRYRLILSDKTFRACFRDHVDVDFMVYAMNSRYYRHQVEQAISGAEGMANNLPLSSLRDFSFAIPPPDEAAAIAGYLEIETSAITTTVARLEREIELVREYRTRLVADVVTGKLDVREAAARLPDDDVTPASNDPDVSDEIDVADDEAIA
jgi:type I restriction enzyme S subunit